MKKTFNIKIKMLFFVFAILVFLPTSASAEWQSTSISKSVASLSLGVNFYYFFPLINGSGGLFSFPTAIYDTHLRITRPIFTDEGNNKFSQSSSDTMICFRTTSSADPELGICTALTLPTNSRLVFNNDSMYSNGGNFYTYQYSEKSALFNGTGVIVSDNDGVLHDGTFPVNSYAYFYVFFNVECAAGYGDDGTGNCTVCAPHYFKNAANSCAPDTRACTIGDGLSTIGIQTWNGDLNNWGDCQDVTGASAYDAIWDYTNNQSYCDSGTPAYYSSLSPDSQRTCGGGNCTPDPIYLFEDAHYNPTNYDFTAGFALSCNDAGRFFCDDNVGDECNTSQADCIIDEIQCNGTCKPTSNSKPAGTSCGTGICTVSGTCCGNGTTESPETCDDGNATNQGTCNSTCSAPTFCGDGTVQTPNGAGVTEECDDGNSVNGDGCNNDCTLPICGNGYVEVDEQCDGNGSGTGGETATCDTNCTFVSCGDNTINTTAGEICEPPNSGTCNSVCTISICGNGYVEPDEECDGNGSGIGGETETCDLDCTFATCGDSTINTTGGEECDPPGGSCNDACLFPVCGNNYVDVGEDCDVWDSPTHSDADSCDADCSSMICGDGYLNSSEVCDGSAPDPYAGATCSSQTSGDKPSGTLSCTPSCDAINETGCYRCGDGEIDGPEVCDDGNLVDGDGCESTCLAVTPGWSCTNNSTPPPESTCQKLCGNGNPSDLGEICDDGNNITETLSDCSYGSTCTFCNAECSEILNFTAPYCGDGNVDIIDAGLDGSLGNADDNVEACDLGAGQNNEPDCPYGETSCTVCLSNCSVEQPGNTSYCGDGVFDPAHEECDYDTGSPNTDGDGCSSTCTLETGYVCAVIDGSYQCVFSCGNGILQNEAPYNEQCDNGSDNGIRCTADTYGFNCDWCTNSCELRTVTGDYCGDGEINTPYENCDQGNTIGGDGCSSSCQIESGWECFGSRSSVCNPISGDGLCVGAPYETCTNNFTDCGACSIGTILTALPGQSVSAVNSVLNAISNLFPASQPRINIPGLNLNNATVDEPLETVISISPTLEGPSSRTPFSLGEKQSYLTVDSINSSEGTEQVSITIE